MPQCCAGRAAQACLVQQLHALQRSRACCICACRHVHLNQLNYDACSYEMERPERVRTIHVKGADSASYEERECYLYKPTFKPLWCDQVHESVIFFAACH